MINMAGQTLIKKYISDLYSHRGIQECLMVQKAASIIEFISILPSSQVRTGTGLQLQKRTLKFLQYNQYSMFFGLKFLQRDAPIYTSPSRDSSPSECPSTTLPSFLRQRASLYGCVKIYQNNNIKCYLEIPLAAALQRSFQQPKLP